MIPKNHNIKTYRRHHNIFYYIIINILQKSLRDTVFELVPAKQKELKELNAKYGEKDLGKVTVSQVRTT